MYFDKGRVYLGHGIKKIKNGTQNLQTMAPRNKIRNDMISGWQEIKDLKNERGSFLVAIFFLIVV